MTQPVFEDTGLHIESKRESGERVAYQTLILRPWQILNNSANPLNVKEKVVLPITFVTRDEIFLRVH